MGPGKSGVARARCTAVAAMSLSAALVEGSPSGAVIDAPRSATTYPAPTTPRHPHGYAVQLRGHGDVRREVLSSSGVPYLTYHDTDAYRRSPAGLIASYPNPAYYAYRS
ncbi:MAG: hypothetical protein HOY79_44415 [Streptomyces sp.]|nr:hypothetical protein [Streptomyces sp.]